MLPQGGTAGTVVPEMAGLISTEIAAHGAPHVSVIGDSAGGNLALAAVEYLVANHETVPASMVLLSPWLDVAQHQSEHCVGPRSLASPYRAWTTDRHGVGRQSPREQLSGESAVRVTQGTPADVCLLGLPGSSRTRRACPPARSRNPRGPNQFRTGQRRNSRLDSDNSGRFPILAADRPGTRRLKTCSAIALMLRVTRQGSLRVLRFAPSRCKAVQ